MSAADEAMVSCSDAHGIVGAVREAKGGLPREAKKRLAKIFTAYFAGYGLEGVYERMNGRTVAQIFAEYHAPENLAVTKSGEIDGVKYTLYGTPPSRRTDDEERQQ